MTKNDYISEFKSYITDDISFEDIDNTLMSDKNIIRPLVGLSFEYLLDQIFIKKLKLI